MTARRNKVKNQLNKQLEPTEEPKEKKKSHRWIINLGKYFLDISKYVITGVVIASLFKDVNDNSIIYLFGGIIAIVTLLLGLVLTNKEKEDE